MIDSIVKRSQQAEDQYDNHMVLGPSKLHDAVNLHKKQTVKADVITLSERRGRPNIDL